MTKTRWLVDFTCHWRASTGASENPRTTRRLVGEELSSLFGETERASERSAKSLDATPLLSFLPCSSHLTWTPLPPKHSCSPRDNYVYDLHLVYVCIYSERERRVCGGWLFVLRLGSWGDSQVSVRRKRMLGGGEGFVPRGVIDKSAVPRPRQLSDNFLKGGWTRAPSMSLSSSWPGDGAKSRKAVGRRKQHLGSNPFRSRTQAATKRH